MDPILLKYKDSVISCLNSTLDLMYNSIDLLDLKKKCSEVIDENNYESIKSNAKKLEEILKKIKETETITFDEEKYVLAALGTTVVHLDYLSRSYSDVAKQLKIIIANVKSKK